MRCCAGMTTTSALFPSMEPFFPSSRCSDRRSVPSRTSYLVPLLPPIVCQCILYVHLYYIHIIYYMYYELYHSLNSALRALENGGAAGCAIDARACASLRRYITMICERCVRLVLRQQHTYIAPHTHTAARAHLAALTHVLQCLCGAARKLPRA